MVKTQMPFLVRLNMEFLKEEHSHTQHYCSSLQHHFLEPAELITGMSSRQEHEEQ